MRRPLAIRAGAILAPALVAVLSLGCVPENTSSSNLKPESKPDAQQQAAKKTEGGESESLANGAKEGEKKVEGHWGTIKGKVLYAESAKLPENKEANVTNDKMFCLSKGKIYQNDWVVDPKTRGVKWCLVWLSDVKDPKKTAWDEKSIHPDLREIPKTLVLDQPVCTFLPRMIGVREGTKVTFKNSAEVGHNVRIEGGDEGPNINQLIPAGKELEVGSITARFIPVNYSCTIHPWMKGYLGVFKHPYYAVTNEKGEFEIKNAPAGKYRLQVWQESYGFVQKNKNDRGVIVTIKDGETNTLKNAIEIKAD